MSTRNTDILNKVFIFATGLAIGSVVTWKYLTTKFEKDILDEIEEEGYEKGCNEEEPEEKLAGAKAIIDYANVLKRSQYGILENPKEEGENKAMNDDVYVIPPEEFYASEFDVCCLTLYADGVLVSEYGEVLDEDEIESRVRKDSLTHFGEYDDDSVYVRNEGLATDYEILRSLRNYKEDQEE